MEPSWELAAVIIALLTMPLAMSPMAAGFIMSIAQRFIRFIRPALGRCERLKWIDIPEGQLHICTLPVENCQQSGGTSTITSFFSLIKRGTFVKKPKKFDSRARYICTDTMTLRTLIILCYPEYCQKYKNTTKFDISWHSVGTHLIARATVNPQKCTYAKVGGISKFEASQLLKGYPPWYRETLKLANGLEVSHPIQSIADLSRGGWIVAIGLSRTQPVRVHNMLGSEPELENFKMFHISNALKRILWRLETLLKVYPNHSLVLQEAHDLVSYISRDASTAWADRMSKGPMSRPYSKWNRSTLGDQFGEWDWFDHHKLLQDKRAFVSSLSKEHCLLIIEVFSRFGDLTLEEIANLRPVMLTALRVVLVGCWELLSQMPSRSKWEKELEEDRMVWLDLTGRVEDEDL